MSDRDEAESAREAEPGARDWRPAALAAAVGAVAFATVFGAMFTAPWSEHVPVNVARGVDDRRPYPKGFFDETDHRFVIWLIARNARTLVTAPQRLFQAEPCHPADDVLALGEPGISLGIMGIPVLLFSREPIVIYNVVLFMVALIGFAVMYLLVREWTGEPAAGIVAGLLYAYHEIKIRDPVHFFAWDTSWTVLALFFASRLIARGRWRDAVGLSLAIAMQLTGSLYPLLTAVVIAVPVVVWLVVRHGVASVRPAPWAAVVLFMGLVAWGVYAPYLSKSGEGVLVERAYQVFVDFDWLRPAGPGFPGFVQIALVGCAFLLPWRKVVREGDPDPRWVLLVVVLLLFSISSGGNTAARLEALGRGEPPPASWPNLWDALAAVVPGLDQVRGPAALWAGVHLALSVLAGLGAAGLLRLAPAAARRPAAAAMVAVAFVELLRPAGLGLSPRMDFVTFPMRPPEEHITFYEALEARGSTGPVLELPLNPFNLDQSSRAVLLGAWHGRRIAQCFNSYLPPEVHRVKRVTDRLPDPDAVHELAAMGFTTLVVHPDPAPGAQKLVRHWRKELAAAAPAAGLTEIALSDALVAYRIGPREAATR